MALFLSKITLFKRSRCSVFALVLMLLMQTGNLFFLCHSCCSVNVSAKPLPEAELQSLLENKGDLHVTDYGQFGELMIGEKRELVLWIQ